MLVGPSKKEIPRYANIKLNRQKIFAKDSFNQTQTAPNIWLSLI